MNILYFFKTYWKSIVVASFIFYVSIIHIPSSVPVPFPHFDKLVHVIMYFALAVAMTWDNFRFSFLLKKSLFYSILLPSVYGGIIEILQENFFPPRSGNWQDFAADFFGAIFGYLFAKMVLKRFFSSNY